MPHLSQVGKLLLKPPKDTGGDGPEPLAKLVHLPSARGDRPPRPPRGSAECFLHTGSPLNQVSPDPEQENSTVALR